MINTKKLLERMLAPKKELLGGNDYVLHSDGGKVLVVAHTDTALPLDQSVPKVRGDRVFGASLDDRLGVYIALDLLPSLGVKVDVLLTDDEEIGRSTASLVPTEDLERYNWICSLDRKGTDVVCYDLGSSEFYAALEAGGFVLGQGSFSDISFLKTKKCCMNLGIGYYEQHTPGCYAELPVVCHQVQKFLRFMEVNENIPYYQDKPSVCLRQFFS